MKKIVMASIRKDAGKTAMALGIASALNCKIGYMKPLGDRLLYRKKRLWDFDSAIFTNLFKIDELPEDMSIGFDHSKLRYMYDEDSCCQRLTEMVAQNSKGKDVLLIEGSQDLSRGVSVHLDPLTICRSTGAELIIVVSGNSDEIIDDLTYLKHSVNLTDINVAGIVVNKIKDVEDFTNVHSATLEDLGFRILGLVPYVKDLTYPTMKFISDILFAKVLTGDQKLGETVHEIFVGAMSADAVLRMERFKKSKKLIITSGDRTDMILAAINTDCIGIVLTNNLLPPPNVLARAGEKNIPVLLSQGDTYKTAKKIDQMVPLLSHTDDGKIEVIRNLVAENIDTDNLI